MMYCTITFPGLQCSHPSAHVRRWCVAVCSRCLRTTRRQSRGVELSVSCRSLAPLAGCSAGCSRRMSGLVARTDGVLHSISWRWCPSSLVTWCGGAYRKYSPCKMSMSRRIQPVHDMRCLCRYAADTRQQYGSKSVISDVAESENQGSSESARLRAKQHADAAEHTYEQLRDRNSKSPPPGLPSRRTVPGGALIYALADMQKTIGTVLVIPTFRIIVLQVRLSCTCYRLWSLTLLCSCPPFSHSRRASWAQFHGMRWSFSPCTFSSWVSVICQLPSSWLSSRWAAQSAH